MQLICSEILFSERLCRLEASHLIFDADLLTSFCMEGSFTEKCYRAIHDFGEGEGGGVVRDRLDIRNITL